MQGVPFELDVGWTYQLQLAGVALPRAGSPNVRDWREDGIVLGMAERKPDEPALAATLQDPEAARLFTELLGNLRGMAKDMGGAQPLIEALSSSFALMSNPKTRSEYDELRRQLIGYLRSLDDGEAQPPAERTEFKASPDISTDDQNAIAQSLLAALAKQPKSE